MSPPPKYMFGLVLLYTLHKKVRPWSTHCVLTIVSTHKKNVKKHEEECFEGDNNCYYFLYYLLLLCSGVVTITECIICMVTYLLVLDSLITKRKNANNYSECIDT